MRKLSKAVVMIILFCFVGLGQTSKTQATLLGTFGPDDSDLLNLLYKIGLILESTSNSSEEIFAVRVCSNDPMPVALAMGSGAPFLTTLRMEKLGIPKSRMFYLRQNKGCRVMSNQSALTEYWLIPKDAEFPSFVEARRASNLLGYQLTNAGDLEKGDRSEIGEVKQLTQQSYRFILDEVIDLLNKNKSAILIIRMPYYKRSMGYELYNRVVETQKYLKVNGIANHRVYLKKLYQGVIVPAGIDAPKYPDLYIVSEN